jgi:uncharacterized membrane protein YkvA (DUF1232 family)
MGSMNELIARGRLVWRLLNDVRVPAWIKVGIPLIVLVYFITPVDLIPDFIPVLGQLDDIGILLLGMALIIRLAPQSVVDEHRLALGYDVPAANPPDTGTNGRSRGRPSGRTQADNGTIDGEYKIVRPRNNE